MHNYIEPESNNSSSAQQQTANRVHISSRQNFTSKQQTNHMFTASTRLRVTSTYEHDMLTELIVLILLLFLKLLKLPISVFCLSLQLIHLFGEDN